MLFQYFKNIFAKCFMPYVVELRLWCWNSKFRLQF